MTTTSDTDTDVREGPERGSGDRSDAVGHRRQRQPGIALDCGAGADVRHVAGIIVLATLVAIVFFKETGQLVLGVLAVVVAFQIVGRVGAWRWSVWDARERTAARTGPGQYPGVRRVVGQSAVLITTMTLLFIAVATNLDVVLWLAGAGLLLAVLLGVAVDVIDAARQDQQTPADSMLRHARARQSRS